MSERGRHPGIATKAAPREAQPGACLHGRVYANPVRGANGEWTIPAEVTLGNTGKDAASASVEIGVFDSAGKEVARYAVETTGEPVAIKLTPNWWGERPREPSHLKLEPSPDETE